MIVSNKGVKQEYRFLRKEILKALDQAMLSEELAAEIVTRKSPPTINRFEKHFAGLTQTKFCVGTNSCTSSLFLALKALKIKEGDEVILPTHTYIATALAITYCKAIPVFCDINDDDLNLDPEEAKKKITKKTKAIIPVHMHGMPADMESIINISKQFNLKIVEDCAQSHGANINGKPVGSFGDAGCFSFYSNKNLGVESDAGALITDNKEIFDYTIKAREFHGIMSGNEILENSRFPSRISLLAAAVLDTKLKYLEEFNQKRVEAGERYNELLKCIKELSLPKKITSRKNVFFSYIIRTKQRNELKNFLEKNGIQTIIEYETLLHLHPVFETLGHKKGDFPVAEKLNDETLSLPMHPFLKEEEIKYVCEKIKEFFNYS